MANGDIVGTTVKSWWYVFEDGIFSFHTAVKEDTRTVFRVRKDRWPAERAKEKDIPYDHMRNATLEEIAVWLIEHPDSKLKGQVNGNVRG